MTILNMYFEAVSTTAIITEVECLMQFIFAQWAHCRWSCFNAHTATALCTKLSWFAIWAKFSLSCSSQYWHCAGYHTHVDSIVRICGSVSSTDSFLVIINQLLGQLTIEFFLAQLGGLVGFICCTSFVHQPCIDTIHSKEWWGHSFIPTSCL